MSEPDRRRSVVAVVVSYNAGPELGVCLASLAAEGVECAVVVDNGSSDDSRQVGSAAGAIWVDAGTNLGYGRAVNLGAARPELSGAEYLLVCNPDIELRPGAVDVLVRALEADRSLGAVGPRLLNTDGSLYPSARTFPLLVEAMGHGLLGMVAPNNPFTRRYRLLDWDHADATTVDWVSGACFLARRSAWDEARGFDPAYFMYMEDVDLCWRLGRAGWKIGYEPAAVVLHVQGVSADQAPYRMLAAHHASMWRFAWRTTTGARRLVLPVVGVGLFVRFGVTAARRWLAGPSAPRVTGRSPQRRSGAPDG